MHPRWIVLGLCLLVCVVAGCNRSGLNLAYVDGVVTYNGQPVQNAGVIFKPESGPFAMGTTDAEGKFTLTTANHAGAIVGRIGWGFPKARHRPGRYLVNGCPDMTLSTSSPKSTRAQQPRS